MNRHTLFAFCLLLIALASCRKEEYKAVTEGEKIPHEELTLTLKEAMNASSYTLFKAAWHRSNMESLLNAEGKNVPHTLLVPTDEAFIADGLTLSAINSMEPRLLDSILLYHTIVGTFDPKGVESKLGSSMGHSMLKNENLRVRAVEVQNRFDVYAYRQYLGILNGELMVNGQKSGKLPAVLAKDGTLWPVNKVLHKPTKTMLSALQEDGRFGMYLGMLETLDQLWLEDSYGIYPRDPYSKGWVLRYDPFGENVNIDLTTIFAPTDAVFHQSGFPDLDALIAFNNSRPRPYLDLDTYKMVGGYAADSLLALNRFGIQFIPYSDYSKDYNQMVFYVNDFTNENLSDFNVMVSQDVGLKAYKMPLDFGRDANGRTLVKAKQSPHPAATVVEQINTLMGPIHVIDRLIPTKEFKF
ncbi:fasciclin domain-containing protein [Pedobacter sp. HMWF019]|uniref:fasciclin domain-containing protein n=1 Tax=Pedobacter sp. HMWF019 TaxID=2056856 RepID=UPI001304806F|nr:fasciclin domain-containing protein [Pedobacter sp. HMWF019]